MRLDLTARARIRAGRRFARLAFGIPSVYGRLRDLRRADLARGLDPDVAVMLAAGKLIGQTAAVAKTPAFERRSKNMTWS